MRAALTPQKQPPSQGTAWHRLLVGRDLLVSSHAGTRLPFAVFTPQGAPPLAGSWRAASALLSERFSNVHRTIQGIIKTEHHLMGDTPCGTKIRFSLRQHYLHQVIGSKVIPSSQPVLTSSPAEQSIAHSPSDVNCFQRRFFIGWRRCRQTPASYPRRYGHIPGKSARIFPATQAAPSDWIGPAPFQRPYDSPQTCPHLRLRQ